VSGKHIPIGLENYARVTSPLRRYPDFITHYQIKAMLRGGKKELPFTFEELSNLMPRIHYTSKKIHVFQQSAINYWKMQYLMQEKRKLRDYYQSYLAIVVFVSEEFGKREPDTLINLFIPALHINTSLRIPSSFNLTEGDVIQLVVDHKDGAPNVNFVPLSIFPICFQEFVLGPEPISNFIPESYLTNIGLNL